MQSFFPLDIGIWYHIEYWYLSLIISRNTINEYSSGYESDQHFLSNIFWKTKRYFQIFRAFLVLHEWFKNYLHDKFSA